MGLNIMKEKLKDIWESLTDPFHYAHGRIRFVYQLWTMGWCDYEVWSIDYHFSLYILPKLEKVQERLIQDEGYTQSLLPDGLSFEEWKTILKGMIDGFREFIENDCFDLEESNYVSAAKYSKNKEDKVFFHHLLFRKYYFHLLKVGL
jgi:hypothetical protein